MQRAGSLDVTALGRPPAKAVIIHVVPADLARGAQTRAKEMRDALEDEHTLHRVLSIFSTPDPAGLVDDALEVTVGRHSRQFSVGAIRALRRYLAEEQPPVIIAYGSEALRYCTLAKPSASRLVYSKTGVMAENLSWLRLSLHRWFARNADHVAAVSSETAREAETLLNVPGRRITMVSNGRDPEKFAPAAATNRPHARLLWIGHVTATKRPDVFLDVAAELRSRGFDFDATLVGDGPELDGLRERARSAGVELLGRRHDVDEVMRSSDIFVFTGERSGEGLPGVLIEASLSALPIVTTDVPGAKDVVSHGSTGLVVGDGTVASMADGVARLLEDEHRRQDMGRKGRRRSTELFTVASSAARWRALLADLVATE